ncbi:hypothetical protein [Ralstonia pseudosolanacearum]|uniref:hypothetical protein n=1 Tax=Ralstonia pseudosolanacearum TaxID=1310165 RepID=UPI002005F9A8|nr:hypothetical protein [Ralstonia pseudosolanacearum]
MIETGFGDMVSDGLFKRSGQGAYAKLTHAVAKATKDAYGKGRGTDPSVIADIASGAVAKHARTRYAVGKYVKQMILIRSWVGDRMLDRMVMSQMR